MTQGPRIVYLIKFDSIDSLGIFNIVYFQQSSWWSKRCLNDISRWDTSEYLFKWQKSLIKLVLLTNLPITITVSSLTK